MWLLTHSIVFLSRTFKLFPAAVDVKQPLAVNERVYSSRRNDDIFRIMASTLVVREKHENRDLLLKLN